jgi:hypothetical protein
MLGFLLPHICFLPGNFVVAPCDHSASLSQSGTVWSKVVVIGMIWSWSANPLCNVDHGRLVRWHPAKRGLSMQAQREEWST